MVEARASFLVLLALLDCTSPYLEQGSALKGAVAEALDLPTAAPAYEEAFGAAELTTSGETHPVETC